MARRKNDGTCVVLLRVSNEMGIRKQKWKGMNMKRRFIPVLMAILLMIVIAGGALSIWWKDKYSYGTEVMDLKTYFGIEDGKVPIFNQNERMSDKALLKDGVCYLNFNFIKSYVNDQFYYDRREKKLIYTDALGSFVAIPGEDGYFQYEEKKEFEGQPCILEGDELYVAISYAALMTDLEYQANEYRLQLITSWEPYESTVVTKETKIRYEADVKSAILCDADPGQNLMVLEHLEKWCKVKTQEGIVGYAENKFLTSSVMVTPEKKQPNGSYVAPEYVTDKLSGKVCLGWHAIGGTGGNSTLEDMLDGAEGMNVISPTWFSLCDNEGSFRSFGEASYVQRAHQRGLEVWAAWDDFNYENETGENIDDTVVFASTSTRGKIIETMIKTSVELGLDGINLDFEKVGADCHEHFGQFLRELSVECRKNALTLSVDNYMPNEGNKQYRLDVQGKVADYVILMGYDEHWHGSGKPGSVASIDFVTEGITKTLEYVPSNKLINAVPFYTIVWKINGSEVTDEYLTLVNEPDFIQRIAITPAWDETTGQNYMEWSSNGKTYKVWLEDLDSISVKLNVMSAKELEGVAAWRLGYGTQELWQLLAEFTDM